MFKNTLSSLFLITFAAYFSACDDNSSAPSNSDNQNYSSEQGQVSNSSNSKESPYSGSENSDPEQTNIIDTPATPSSSSTSNASFDNPSGERIVCKGIYSNLVIQNTIYPESYHCEDGNSCAKDYASACTETECQSIIMYTCSDESYMNEEKFSKKYTLETCEGGYCQVYCYNNEIVLEDGDSLKVINCDNGVTYLRDGAYERKNAGKSIPDTLEEKPSLGTDFAVNCDYGEELCVATTDEGRCFMTTNTIECPRKE
jgi:hypothetical protein